MNISQLNSYEKDLFSSIHNTIIPKRNKNFDTKGIISKFKGRGDIKDAFVFAMKDLEKAIKSLSDKQKEKIFNNGYNFMNLEVIWPKSSNVIDYDKAELVFHGALIYNDAGVVKGEVKDISEIKAKTINKQLDNITKIIVFENKSTKSKSAKCFGNIIVQ